MPVDLILNCKFLLAECYTRKIKSICNDLFSKKKKWAGFILAIKMSSFLGVVVNCLSFFIIFNINCYMKSRQVLASYLGSLVSLAFLN